MNKIIIDSCVFFKTIIDEDDSELAIKLLSNCIDSNVRIIVPNIFHYEIFAAVIRTNQDIAEVLSLIEDYKKYVFEPINLSYDILLKIKEITKSGSKQSGYPSFYDSVYQAIAIIEDCNFITADQKHYQKTKKFGNIKLLKDI